MKEKFYAAADTVISWMLGTGMVQNRYRHLYSAVKNRLDSFINPTSIRSLKYDTDVEMKPIEWVIVMDTIIHACDACQANYYQLMRRTDNAAEAVQCLTTLIRIATQRRDACERHVDALDWACKVRGIDMRTAATLHCELQNNNW